VGNIATTYEVCWSGGRNRAEYEGERAAKEKGRRESIKRGGETVTVLKYEGEEPVYAWAYIDGRQTQNTAEGAKGLAGALDPATPEGEEVSEPTTEQTTTERPAPSAGRPTVTELHEQFGSRDGTNKKQLLERLGGSFGNPVSIGDLILAVYGVKRKGDLSGPLLMVMKGLLVAIERKGLPYRIEKSVEDKQRHYTLRHVP
jgi:hypothetical protein